MGEACWSHWKYIQSKSSDTHFQRFLSAELSLQFQGKPKFVASSINALPIYQGRQCKLHTCKQKQTTIMYLQHLMGVSSHLTACHFFSACQMTYSANHQRALGIPERPGNSFGMILSKESIKSQSIKMLIKLKQEKKKKQLKIALENTILFNALSRLKDNLDPRKGKATIKTHFGTSREICILTIY